MVLKVANGTDFEIKGHEIPLDGDFYRSSIEKLFPKEIVDDIFQFNPDALFEKLAEK